MYKIGSCTIRNHIILFRNKLNTSPLSKLRSLREDGDLVKYTQNGKPLIVPYRLHHEEHDPNCCGCQCGGFPPCPPPKKENTFLKGLLALLSGMLVGGVLAYIYRQYYPPEPIQKVQPKYCFNQSQIVTKYNKMLKVGACVTRNHNLVKISNLTCVGPSKKPLNNRYIFEHNDFLTYNQNGLPLVIPYRLNFNPFARAKPKTIEVKRKVSMKGFIIFILKSSLVLFTGMGIGGFAAYFYLMIYRPAQKARRAEQREGSMNK